MFTAFAHSKSPRVAPYLGAGRSWCVESKNRPQRGQCLTGLQLHSQSMGQRDGKKWTAALDVQPMTCKSDRFFGAMAGVFERMTRWVLPCLLAACATIMPVHAASQWIPAQDDEVVQVLPTVTTQRPALVSRWQGTSAKNATAITAVSDEQLVQTVRADIAAARRSGDARYWGRAEAALKGRWDRAGAAPDLAVLQATVLQGRHAFVQAEAVLADTLSKHPEQAQAWLNLATLQKLSGRYREAGQSCAAMQRTQASLYAAACGLEVRSMLGEDQAVSEQWGQWQAQTADPAQLAWLLSLSGEHEERMGRPASAIKAYQRSMQLNPDTYTAVALADILLRREQAQAALDALQQQPDTDPILIRRALAYKKITDPRWQAVAQQLRERQAAIERRGDDTTPVARELGLAALWLHNDSDAAVSWATANLSLQHESIDWMLALLAARAANNSELLQQWSDAWRKTGLVDARLSALALPPSAMAQKSKQPVQKKPSQPGSKGVAP